MSELRDINTILKNLDADQCILYFRNTHIVFLNDL
jgi:hypothetical protein